MMLKFPFYIRQEDQITLKHVHLSLEMTFEGLEEIENGFQVFEAIKSKQGSLLCFRKIHPKEHPIVVILHWKSTKQDNCCFVVQKEQKAALLNLRNEMIDYLPEAAIERRFKSLGQRYEKIKHSLKERHSDEVGRLNEMTKR